MATTKTPATKVTTKAAPATTTAKKMYNPTVSVSTTGTVRMNHESCTHERHGAEGKKARAACRKAYALEHAAKLERDAKKAARAVAPKPAPRPRAPKPVAEPTPVTAVEDLTVDA